MSAPRGLLIGCGNIGALYDLGQPGVLTHAKALATLGIPFDVVEPDAARAQRVIASYGGRAYDAIDAVNFANHDLVCVASSTATHEALLSRLLLHGTRLIICEKPLAARSESLNRLRQSYDVSRSIVLVNYIRRFQPGFRALRDRLRERPGGPTAGLQGIVVRYQRGFLNNAGHALDLLSFLFGSVIELDGLNILRAENDTFSDDPTLSAAWRWAGVPVCLLGFPDNGYVIFELELDFRDARIVVSDRGDRLDWFSLGDDGPERPAGPLVRDPARSGVGLLSDYMLPVLRHGLDLLAGADAGRGNFLDAWALNLKMARVLENLAATR